MRGAPRPIRLSLRLALWVLAGTWSTWFAWAALERWRREAICAMACGPYWPADMVEEMRRAFDWQTPLGLAALPWACLALYRLGMWLRARFASGGRLRAGAERPRR